ncbi:MAG: aminoacetone oxidase family FAD-binding enzyme [Tissierellia bacterium]|nr:aminoacetone oxidase family FAD-binding enzyme [Tissierellia bacterium]
MKITIIGGGAAGLSAAILLAPYFPVTVLEGEDRIGKKLLTTGNGRCNLTNKYINVNRYHGSNKEFIESILEQKGREDTIDFFHSLGLSTVEESNKLYPVTLQASSVINVFLQELNHLGVKVHTKEKVLSIQKREKQFIINTRENTYTSDIVILATGGKTAPKTGSDGSGYALVKSLGHHVTKTFPALVQLKAKSPYLKHLKGTKVVTTVKLYLEDELVQEKEGELLFTDYGVSGPPILDHSRKAIEGLQEGKKVEIEFSLLNHITENGKKEIEEIFYRKYDRSLIEFLTGILHKKFHQPLLKELQIKQGTNCFELEGRKKEQLFSRLFASKLEITGHLQEKHAQVTCGGVPGKELTSSCESKILPGLFILGELIDVDGDCGGFNLQWAWSTAMVAASKIIEQKI